AGGAAGNLDSHGLLVLINGGFGSAMSYSIRASGNITAYSDERLKTNWRPMPEDFVSRLAEVRVGIYDRTDGQQITQVGVSAQSLQELLPEAITAAKDEMGTLSVNYGGAALASAVELAKAIKEQQNVINKQQQEITELKDVVLKLLEKLS
ncbi:MAG: tail fiber domain-containing protein, partial [Pirellulales bacterium]|nr:tail fiber domain-containing protein [Pirellulales bacterium]